MHKVTTLESGLRIVTSPLEGTKSITVLCLVGAGSRNEKKEINGISHFLEHMFFKGAKKYKKAADVSSAIDAVGADFNAFTGKEYAGYFVKCASRHKEIAFDVLGDMMINSTFLPEEIEKERGVILEEFNMYQDTPVYQVAWDFEHLVFGDQPLGWDEVGSKEVIKRVTQNDFVHYKKSLYTPDNTVISVAGDLEESEIVGLTKKFFPFDDGKRAYQFVPYRKIAGGKKVNVRNKKTEQGHLILGVEAVPARHPDEFTAKILSVILGGNMSSRMFLGVRESKGLCYYIRTNTDVYADTGTLSTSAGVDLTRADMAIQAILNEYKRISEEKVSPSELKKAKEFMKGKIILRLEDSEEVSHLMGKQALLYDTIDSVDEIIRKTDAVTADDVLRLSRELFKEENLRLSLIGPFEDESHFENLLHF
ncbi:insulinase family protein [Candidatus Peregrinibacteria bacterium]|nr:insulinase family protein [Candidatus Peregrinibacteria bacterium]